MKHFFARACAKIGRFFWSWGFLKFVLWSVTLVILFYVEEDWRGARAWAATKAEWEAKGESFDLNKFTPPLIPDNENLAAIPLFKIEPHPGSNDKTTLYFLVLQGAMHPEPNPSHNLPPRGNWMRGELPDMEKIRLAIAATYAAAFKDVPPPQDTLDLFNALYPFTADLRAASSTRPFFRFPEDYTVSPPAGRALGKITTAIQLSWILTLHAMLALDHHQPDLALEDIKINYKLASGSKRDPSLVGGLVAIGVNAITQGAIYDGLAHHAWSDAQLIEIDHTLEPINFLADYQFAMRSEAAYSITNFDYFKNAHRSHLYELFGMSNQDLPLMTRFAPPWPDGWWDDNKSRMATFVFQSLADVDPQARLIFPKEALDLQHQIEQANARWDAYAPWKILSNIAAGPVTNAASRFAQAQTWVDEARIACALERYRFAHGIYPGSLDALAPAYIDSVPHDIMNGQPYHYQLRPDGTYLLYSVGWNQIDEGGKIVYQSANPEVINYTQGDWVWPTPQATSVK